MPPTPNLDAALAKLQGILPRIVKGETGTIPGKDGKQGYSYRYADLTDISDVILPLLSKCGLAFTAMPDVDGGMFGLRYALRHESGEQDGGFYPLPDPSRTTPQQVGSAITYARRYSLCAATGTAPGGDDDDAASAQAGYEPATEADRGSTWMPPANPNSRKADRHNAGRRGPLPDDQWTAVSGQTGEVNPPAETMPGTSTPDQHQDIAIRLDAKGLTGREAKLLFCGQSARRKIGSSKDLSYTEAVAVLRAADALPVPAAT